MKNFLLAVVVVLTLIVPVLAEAEGVKVFVEPFTVAGGADPSLGGGLQNLFSSRLSSNDVLVQQAPAGAQLLVKGSLTQLGKSFSIDVAAVENAGTVVARGYEQGEGADAILPALNKLAEKLRAQLVAALAARRAAATQAPPAVVAPVPTPAPGTVVRATPVESGNVVRAGNTPAQHQRLEGVYLGIAPARTLANGEREAYLAREGRLSYCRIGAKVETMAEVTLPLGEKVIAVDSADLDGDGMPEAYLTVLRSGELASQVWSFNNGKLTRLAAELPYFFRNLSGPGQEGKLYAQQMGRTEDFYGPVYEVKRSGGKVELANPLALPDSGNIYNFTRFSDAAGTLYTLLYSPDGNLVVYSADGTELWRSNDHYGGSATYIGRADAQNQTFTGSAVRKIFLQPRIEVARSGDIVLPQNTGTFVVGQNRSYSKHAVYAFAWNGATLEERWHTHPVDTYLPDFRYDEERGELVLLEVVKQDSLMSKGASTVTVKKVK